MFLRGHFGTAEEILRDFGDYRKKFLTQKDVEIAWKNIIRDHWTMSEEFVTAVDLFYKNQHTEF